MNENEMNNGNGQNTYHATTNLNVDIENPQMQVNSAVGMNIQNSRPSTSASANSSYPDYHASSNFDSGNYENQSFNQDMNSFSNNHSIDANVYSSEVQPTHVEYKPIITEQKKRKSFQIPGEVKVTAFIIFILLIFVLLIPYIYDFFKGLQLSLMR